MMRLTDAASGLDAALDLVETLSGEGALSPHAGVHAGSVIERDLDIYGNTVNLASRLEAHTKLAARAILIDGATRDALHERVHVDALGEVSFKGKAAGVAVYAVPAGQRI